MKFALVQFTPIPRNVPENIKRIETLLETITDPDVILTPEMALTGYIFNSKQEVVALLNEYKDLMLQFPIQLAKRFNCMVQVGLPRRCSIGNLYNSVLFAEPNGNSKYYDKHHLFESDECWANEGKSFDYQDTEKGRIGFGICMDVNPYQFKAPFDAFEFVNYHLANKSKILLLSMAWLTPGTPITSSTIPDALNYWALRLKPLIDESNQDVIIAICNRTGTEQETRFIGCSCILKINDKKITLLGNLGINNEAVLVVNT